VAPFSRPEKHASNVSKRRYDPRGPAKVFFGLIARRDLTIVPCNVMEESFMPSENRYVRLVYRLLPVGALGMSVALGAAPEHASAAPAGAAPQQGTSDGASVATQLQAIREAVSTVAQEGGLRNQINDPNIRLAWWLNENGRGWGNGGQGWGNGGGPRWGNGGFHNWGNGGHYWRNY
jgi:rSAM-associated Gly-rich repeat protein